MFYCILQAIKHLKFGGVLIDQQYEKGFERAILTFRHQRVYDPTKAEMVHLTDISSELSIDLEFLGPYPFSSSMCKLALKFIAFHSYLKPIVYTRNISGAEGCSLNLLLII